MLSNLVRGAIAGAAGTVALDIVTYADMALRARPSSEMPANLAGALAGRAGLPIEDVNRKSGVGALFGYATGLGVGVAYGLVSAMVTLPTPIAALGLGAAAMASSDVMATRLGVADPSSWSSTDWASDVIPHLAYGLVAAAVFAALGDD